MFRIADTLCLIVPHEYDIMWPCTVPICIIIIHLSVCHYSILFTSRSHAALDLKHSGPIHTYARHTMGEFVTDQDLVDRTDFIHSVYKFQIKFDSR